MKTLETNNCIECGKPVIGRTDKKFCSLTCKNKHNNRLHKDRRELRIAIINKISRNYEILEILLEEEPKFFSLEELSKLGFDIRYISGVQHIGTRNQTFLCFDMAFSYSGSKISRIRRVDPTTL